MFDHKEFLEQMASVDEFKQLYFKLIEQKLLTPKIHMRLVFTEQKTDAPEPAAPEGLMMPPEMMSLLFGGKDRKQNDKIVSPSFDITPDMAENILKYIINEKVRSLNSMMSGYIKMEEIK